MKKTRIILSQTASRRLIELEKEMENPYYVEQRNIQIREIERRLESVIVRTRSSTIITQKITIIKK